MPSFKDVVNFLNDPTDVAHTKFVALTTESYNEYRENCVSAVKQERQ